MEFSRQEYWRGLPFPTPRDLPDPGIVLAFLASPALARIFCTTMPPGHAKGDRWHKSKFSTSKCKSYHDISLVVMNLSEFQGSHITPYLKSFLEGIVNIFRLQVRGVIVDSLPAEQKRKIHGNHVSTLFYYNTSFLLASFKNESFHKSDEKNLLHLQKYLSLGTLLLKQNLTWFLLTYLQVTIMKDLHL